MPDNLPQQTTSFIGRENEIESIKSLLGKTRLLTLTGSGGCGKTRLSLQVAADVLENYSQGVWLAELAPITDPTLVVQAVAQALGVTEEAGKPLLQTLMASLKDRKMLLILDNCEHVLEASALLVNRLMRACPNLTILASSREGLGIGGETVFHIPSLSLPDLKQTATPANLKLYEAVRLFVDRATAVQPTFEVTNQNAPAVASICHHLDGIPLAIELAAARVRALSAEGINVRLDNRFRLLTGGSRTALPRQQTLRALIDWSYDLLNAQEKTLLCRLSVFADGWTMAAAEAVGTSESDTGNGLEEWEVLDLLTSLVDKSLIMAEQHEDHSRYHMLETIRQYARDRSAEQNEMDLARDRHETFFRAFAEQAVTVIQGPERAGGIRSLLDEQENLRSALEWSLQTGQAKNAARLAVTMESFWHQTGAYREGANWFSRVIPAVEAIIEAELAESALVETDLVETDLHEADLLVEALISGAAFYWRLGEYDVSRLWLDKAVPLARVSGNKAILWRTLTTLANNLYYQGEFAASRPLYVESLELARQSNEKAIGASLNNLALAQMDAGEDATAQTLFEEALAIRRNLGNPHGIANILGSLGELAARQGNHDKARRLLQEALDIMEQNTHKPLYAEIIRSLAPLKAQEGNRSAANSLMIECLQIRQELDDKWGIAVALEDTAALIATEQSVIEQSVIACTLLAAAQSLRDKIGAPRTPVQEREHHRYEALLQECLPGDVFAQARTNGSALTAGEAIEQAIAVLSSFATIPDAL